MAADLLTVLIVVSLGLFTGTGAGLLIGYLAKKQKKTWGEMSWKDHYTNLALAGICSVICIAALAWYALV
jgi:ABC-type antimicrobial peptide transport system permease subunit